MSKFRIIGRKTWDYGYGMGHDGENAPIVVTETVNDENDRRWTATICGFGNWKLGMVERGHPQSKTFGDALGVMQSKACAIRRRILAGDDSVFNELNEWEVL